MLMEHSDSSLSIATSNPDFTAQVRIPTGGRRIVGIRVFERHYSGLTDVSFLSNSGPPSARAFESSDEVCANGTRGDGAHG